MVSSASGSSKTADAGTPSASAVRAMTRASMKLPWVEPPVTISRGATPRSYSCTASVTRASCAGVGFPSESAGVPSTIMASNRVGAVFPAGAKARARYRPDYQDHDERRPAENAPGRASSSPSPRHMLPRVRPAHRGLAGHSSGCRLAGQKRRTPGSTLSRSRAGQRRQNRGRISVYISPALPVLPMPTRQVR